VSEVVRGLGERIKADFRFDRRSTDVDTLPRRAFEIRRGVCQDFSHVMIAACAASAFPPAMSAASCVPFAGGKERLAGADAMHAWVRAWCGNESGWVGYDPTNATFAGEDHIAVAIGRDYEDVRRSPGCFGQQAGRRRASRWTSCRCSSG